MIEDLSWLGERLAIDGELVEAARHGSGHINDTFRATYRMRSGEARRRFIHQRINDVVFHDPRAVMDNLSRVTRHIRAALEAAGADDIERRVLTLVPAADGGDFVLDAQGGIWRTFLFIEGAATFDVVADADQAREVGRAFGEFQCQLSDLPPPPLVATIPGFHDTPARLRAFRDAVGRDASGRAAAVADEIERVEGFAHLADRLQSRRRAGEIPLRNVHNDTKINNVLIDRDSGEGLCVIDLDTVMPGLAADDFGDLVRTSCSFAREDDRDLSKVRVERPLFEALAEGYLSAAAGFLTAAEIDSLVIGAELMTYEMVLRFLGDHLDGDTYFRVHREGHNLDRARVQLALLDSIVDQEAELRAIIAAITARHRR